MRAPLTSLLLIVAMATLQGCWSSSKKAEAEATRTEAAVEFHKQCGDPVRFPISDECVRLAGEQGTQLRRRSDLTVAVWRNCALIPSSAETIRQELTAKGSAKTTVGEKMIGEMERTEQHSDSPCVAADLRDLDCVAGNVEACENARNGDRSCMAWLNDNDTQQRLRCIDRAVHNQACMAKQSAGDESNADSGAANYFSDAPAQAEDCRRIESACLHTFDECANAKDALDLFLKPQKPAALRPAQ